VTGLHWQVDIGTTGAQHVMTFQSMSWLSLNFVVVTPWVATQVMDRQQMARIIAIGFNTLF
jgi:hypothetical protein